MDWIIRRKIIINSILLIILLIISLIIYFSFFYISANCFDGRKNQNELGIDCSGECLTPCAFEVKKPIVLWTKSFETRIDSDFYNILSIINNPNNCFISLGAKYKLDFFDLDDNLIETKQGQLKDNISCQSEYVFYLNNLKLKGKPHKINLNLSDFSWQKSKKENQLSIVSSSDLYQENNQIKLDLSFKNKALIAKKDFKIFVLLEDKNGNTIYFQQTIIDFLDTNETDDFTFSWPESLIDEKRVSKFKIIFQK